MNLYDILCSEDVVSCIKENEEYLFKVIPELKFLVNFDQKHPHHHLDAYNHTLCALSLSNNDFDVRLSLLLHDIGKPFSYQEGEVRHFKGHAEVSSKISILILSRLNFNYDYILKISNLIKLHDTMITNEDINNDYENSLKRYEVQRCDALAHHPDKLEKRKEYLSKTLKKFNK